MKPESELIHASTVAMSNHAVIIIGASGAGKSALALQMMAHNATLVADDQTKLTSEDQVLFASSPDAIKGQIEARGVGLLAAETVQNVPVVLAVNLDEKASGRLPPRQTITFLGVEIDLINGAGQSNLPATILQFLKGGRVA